MRLTEQERSKQREAFEEFMEITEIGNRKLLDIMYEHYLLATKLYEVGESDSQKVKIKAIAAARLSIYNAVDKSLDKLLSDLDPNITAEFWSLAESIDESDDESETIDTKNPNTLNKVLKAYEKCENQKKGAKAQQDLSAKHKHFIIEVATLIRREQRFTKSKSKFYADLVFFKNAECDYKKLTSLEQEDRIEPRPSSQSKLDKIRLPE